MSDKSPLHSPTADWYREVGLSSVEDSTASDLLGPTRRRRRIDSNFAQLLREILRSERRHAERDQVAEGDSARRRRGSRGAPHRIRRCGRGHAEARTKMTYSAFATRTYNRLAARPNVGIAHLFAPSSPRLGMVASNLGPGIALIDEFNVSLDGNRLPGDWEQQWQKFRKDTDSEDWTDQGGFVKGDGSVASSSNGGEIMIIVDEHKFNRDKNRDEWAGLSERLKGVVRRETITIRFHSVYHKYFEVEKTGLEPTRYRRRNWLGHYVDWQH
jgi:hypothetical protein